MNYMPEVLKMLGVEIKEEFNLKGEDFNPYLFNDSYELNDCCGHDRTDMLKFLITNEIKIEKLPWKPKDNEIYYYVDHNGGNSQRVWKNSTFDYALFNSGNFFKKHEDITPEKRKRIFEEMKGKYENEC